MLNNYIFQRLAGDETDSLPSSVLADVNRFMNLSLTESELPPYTYTSLKTLLGEESDNELVNDIPAWAIRRLLSGKFQAKFREVDTPAELPLILIKCSNLRPHPRRNNKVDYQATVEITVQTNPETVDSSIAFSLIQRIHSRFTAGHDQPIDLADGVTEIKGIKNLTLQRQAMPLLEWDVVKAVYIADAKIIE